MRRVKEVKLLLLFLSFLILLFVSSAVSLEFLGNSYEEDISEREILVYSTTSYLNTTFKFETSLRCGKSRFLFFPENVRFYEKGLEESYYTLFKRYLVCSSENETKNVLISVFLDEYEKTIQITNEEGKVVYNIRILVRNDSIVDKLFSKMKKKLTLSRHESEVVKFSYNEAELQISSKFINRELAIEYFGVVMFFVILVIISYLCGKLLRFEARPTIFNLIIILSLSIVFALIIFTFI